MWPTYDRYNSAVHQPESCFGDPVLRASWPQRDKRGLPAPATGAFGCVYHMHTWEQSWAVKCFIREVLTSEWRYTEVSAYIRTHPSPFLVQCDYLVPRGIMVDGRWYPVLKMAWVEGKTLDRYIEDHLGQAPVMESLAGTWAKAMRSLEERNMAHGDLQHGNVLVNDEGGEAVMRLVDYDGMYVPSFKGEEGNESGLRDYQHPRRSGRDFNEYMDNFAALVIYISLRALAYRADLWGRYHTGENLLFQRKDFEDPGASPLMAELRTLPNPRLASLLDTLEEACRSDDPCSLPSLYSLVTGQPALRPAPAKPTPMPVPVPPPGEAGLKKDEMTVLCPTCGVSNRAIARYCRGCGLALPYTAIPGNAPLPLVGVAATTPQPQVRICPWCGRENPAGTRWCLNCTALLD